MANKGQRTLREEEQVNIIVSGEDLMGHSFEEQTESVNISSSGILFYLNTSIGPRSFVSIDLGKSKEFGYLGKVSAVVVRIEISSPGKHLVAAEFI
ncbi:MAG: hypothetical protein U0V70_04545 [Terriglobia bacterium]